MELVVFKNVVVFVKYYVIVIMCLVFVDMVVEMDGRVMIVLMVSYIKV